MWLTARQLHGALAGRVLTRSDFRVPRFATADLTGQTVTETASRGKHLLTRTDAGVTVHTHLRMDGSWRVRPAAETSGRPSATCSASWKSCPPPPSTPPSAT